MKKKVLDVICSFVVLLVLLSIRTTAIAQAVTAQEPWKAPSMADALKNPNKPTTTVIREGANLYALYCVSCHDKNGFGRGALGRDLPVKPSSFYDANVTSQTDGALFWKLSEGRGTMPGFKATLSEEKRWALVTYIRQFSSGSNALASAAPKVLSPTAFRMDPKLASSYFPVPGKILNVSSSQDQLFMVDTVITGLLDPWGMAFLPDKTILIKIDQGQTWIRRKKKFACSILINRSSNFFTCNPDISILYAEDNIYIIIIIHHFSLCDGIELRRSFSYKPVNFNRLNFPPLTFAPIGINLHGFF